MLSETTHFNAIIPVIPPSKKKGDSIYLIKRFDRIQNTKIFLATL